MHDLSVSLWDLRTMPLWSKWTKDLTLYCLNKIKEIMILTFQNFRKPIRQTILLIGIIWWAQFQSYMFQIILEYMCIWKIWQNFNSNSNSNSWECQLQFQLQLWEFQLQLQLQLRQVSWISTPTPTPTPTPGVSTPTPTPTPASLLNINSNSNSNSGGFNSNSNSNSGVDPNPDCYCMSRWPASFSHRGSWINIWAKLDWFPAKIVYWWMLKFSLWYFEKKHIFQWCV